MPDIIFVRVHAMPCINKCWHCFCNGSPKGRFMEEKNVLRVLDALLELKEKTGVTTFPLYYDEPTLHPGIINILRYQLERNLIFDQWWFPTNGYGLARMSDSQWKTLAEIGLEGVRLTFHGPEEMHDRLAGRKGAYRDLVKTIEKSEEFGIVWFAGMVLNTENASTYEEVKATVDAMGTPCSEFGWMLPQSQGRAADSRSRVTMKHIGHLAENSRIWKTEQKFIQEILTSSDLSSRKALNQLCGTVHLDIDQDLNVFYGGGCDGDPFYFIKNQVILGNLNTESMQSCYERYENNPPRPVQLLSEITWGELAEKYGDTDSLFLHHLSDLPGRKWSEAYLKDCLH